jgi:type I restriction enzyme R subunit
VLIITDRTELDEQIEEDFLGVGEEIRRTISGAYLVGLLNASNPPLNCSLVHKFGSENERCRSRSMPRFGPTSSTTGWATG